MVISQTVLYHHQKKNLTMQLLVDVLLHHDSTEAKQICQSKDVVHGPLQTQNDDDPGEIDEVPAKGVDFLLQNILVDVKVHGVDKPTAVSCSPPVSPSREKSKLMTSGSNIKQNDTAALDESSTEVKEHNFPVKDTKEDKGKAWSSAIVYGDTEDVSSVVSIEDCLALHFEAEVIERLCENCAKASQNASTLNQHNGKQVKLDDSAHQVEQKQNELKDMSRYAIETRSFSKLPPVLIIHLKRTLLGLIKASGHVRFEEILDVGPFMTPVLRTKIIPAIV